MCKIFSYLKTNGALVNIVFLSNDYYYYYLTCPRNLSSIGLWQIVYDVTAEESFNKVKNWLRETGRYANVSVPKLLVGDTKNLDEENEEKVVKRRAGQVNLTLVLN